MNPNLILQAMVKADEFIEKAKEAKERIEEDPLKAFGCKETAACRRASMDLTRILARLRNSR